MSPAAEVWVVLTSSTRCPSCPLTLHSLHPSPMYLFLLSCLSTKPQTSLFLDLEDWRWRTHPRMEGSLSTLSFMTLKVHWLRQWIRNKHFIYNYCPVSTCCSVHWILHHVPLFNPGVEWVILSWPHEILQPGWCQLHVYCANILIHSPLSTGLDCLCVLTPPMSKYYADEIVV